ncbi:TPA_exp: Uncharacterized protein A8136_2808 [Trichophyton benhamiae CBS 112371]|nr:TPA_exp: Uncharacterized protein A8136_2808 [Trichophyton benhamiae CBS 112371]
MRGILITFLLTWLLSLSTYASGADDELKDNKVSHVFERIWLWEMYDFICEVDTPEGQKLLFPIDKTVDRWRHNVGSQRDKRLTYAQFQKRLQEGGNPQGGALPMINSPAEGDPFRSARQLLDLGWDGKFSLKEVAPRVKDVTYRGLIAVTEQYYSQYRIDLEKQPWGSANDPVRIARIATITEAIRTLRYQDRHQYITDTVTSKKIGGLGLAKVVAEKLPTALTYEGSPLGPEYYERTDWQKTYNANCIGGDDSKPGPELRAIGVTENKKFKEIMFNFGKENDKDSSAKDKNHLRTLNLWNDVQKKAHKSVEELIQCK